MDLDDFTGSLEKVFAGIPSMTLTDEQREQVREHLAAGAAGAFFGLQASAAPTRPSGVAAVAAARRDIERNPEAARVGGGGSRVLLASGSATWQPEPVTDKYVLGAALCEHLQRMDRHGPARGVSLVASAFFDYPKARKLTGNEGADIRLLDAVVGQQALTASGGICAPTDIDYEVKTWATAERPLKEGLPAFEIPRGGLLYIEPPTLNTVAPAIGIWSEATDAEPLAATKPVYQVTCGNTLQVYANAVTDRLGFGNMQARFQPELMAAYVDLAQSQFSRKAEIKLLELVAAAALASVTSAKNLGATRDLITAILQGVANFKFTNRLPRKALLTAIFPAWVMDLLKIDMAKETAHQQGSDWNALAITDEQVTDSLKAHGINPIWMLDGLPEKSGGSGYPAQTFAVQGASEAIKSFPTKLVWHLFPEGAVQYLDGGRLDVGVVRDASLDSTNDFELFSEQFESIANRGFSHAIVQYVTELCANGSSAATVDTHTVCA
jgi:hypothetical protein